MSAKPFQIQIEQEVLDDLRERLQHVRWPSQLGPGDWTTGIPIHALEPIVTYWKESFDWRKSEKELNRFHHFFCSVDGFPIHFIHERGIGPKPLPIILSHGWPDSFLRYQKIILALSDPGRYGGDPADAFDVVVPSLPGFGFSKSREGKSLNNLQIADLWVKLMAEHLGYPTFAAGGGDVGSGVSRYIAERHPEKIVGLHVTDIGIIRAILASPDNSLDAAELTYKREATQWMVQEGGYMTIQSTKPQTLSYALTDSPVGLAAWILEKFHGWSDPQGKLQTRDSWDELLTNITLYWITGTIGSSAHVYYNNSRGLTPLVKNNVPTGLALFPADILLPPEDWVRKNFAIQRLTHMPRGGHFTAWEEPELFVEDIREFFRPLRSRFDTVPS
jgi:pimeloyl-ACP methyl ester carboxylesterase